MILFVFEGQKREPALFRSLERVILPESNERIICSYGNNIHALYQTMTQNGKADEDEYLDLVSILRERGLFRTRTTLSIRSALHRISLKSIFSLTTIFTIRTWIKTQPLKRIPHI